MNGFIWLAGALFWVILLTSTSTPAQLWAGVFMIAGSAIMGAVADAVLAAADRRTLQALPPGQRPEATENAHEEEDEGVPFSWVCGGAAFAATGIFPASGAFMAIVALNVGVALYAHQRFKAAQSLPEPGGSGGPDLEY